MKPQKLTWDKVDQIRQMYKPGEIGYKTLGRMLGVSVETIKSIIREETWKPSKDWRNKNSNQVQTY